PTGRLLISGECQNERSTGNPALWATPTSGSPKDSPPPLWPNSPWGKVRIAKFKLDWIFVKSELENPRDQKGSYVLAPDFARTLSDLNNSLPEPISDHSPMT